MRLEQYESTVNAAQTVFTFISKGPKGEILKRVQYTKLKIKNDKNNSSKIFTCSTKIGICFRCLHRCCPFSEKNGIGKSHF
jgi:hypothetical protein